jgi:hypothetical protein
VGARAPRGSVPQRGRWLDVKALDDDGTALLPSVGGGGVLEHLRQRVGQPGCVRRRHQQPGDLVIHDLRDAGVARRHHGQPHRHGLQDHVGDAVAVAVIADDAGQHEQ